MLKLAGSVMIVLACTLAGYCKSLSLKNRHESIKKIIYSLHIMENEINYGKNSMNKILEKIGIMNGLKFNIADAKNAEEAFLSAINTDKLAISKAEEDAVRNFSKSLGKTDSYVQLKNIKNTVRTLEILEKDAKEEYEKFGRMYRNIGILSGLMLVILLV